MKFPCKWRKVEVIPILLRFSHKSTGAAKWQETSRKSMLRGDSSSPQSTKMRWVKSWWLPYLSVYSKARFDHITEKINGLNQLDKNVRMLGRIIISEAQDVSVDSQGRIAVSSELWERIDAKPGDEICVFNNADKLEICTKSFYDNLDHDLSNIMGMETQYYVDGL